MKEYEVEVIEDVVCTIRLKVEAESAEEAAKIARHMWVTGGLGEKYEAVNEREVYVDGEHVETTVEDE